MGFIKEEYRIKLKNGDIFGLLYTPIGKGPFPVIIISHGFTGSYRDNIDYAQYFVQLGYMVYIFDFRGGSIASKSSGKFIEMSVMTEVKDLEGVLVNIKKLPEVNQNRIILIGKSQGGTVSAIVAARHSNEIYRLILIYPALIIHDDLRNTFKGKTLEEVPDFYPVFDNTIVGKIYAIDMWDYDIYQELGNYHNPVLIIHGTEDEIVPIEYSEKAAQVYENVTFIPIKGAGHGFGTKFTPIALDCIENFLNQN